MHNNFQLEDIGTKASNLIKLEKELQDGVIPELVVINSESDLDEQFEKCSKVFKTNEIVAFRSSANLEDLSNASFAGMFNTYLNVEFTKENFFKYVEKCFNAKNNPRLIEYAKTKGIDLKDLKISVVVQRMFKGKYAGVAFVYPKKNNSLISIASESSVVDGDKSIELKFNEEMYEKFPNGVSREVWEELVENLNQIITYFKSPQDIEWAVNENGIAILQSRPITSDVKEYSEQITWDATNIGENYPGTTLPLTFTFIKNAYSNVYQNFLKEVGVDPKVIKTNKSIFDNMLGYVNGHIFYNINNWYQVLKLLPFYESNKVFFDNMLSPVKNKEAETKEKFKFKPRLMYKFVLKIIYPKFLFKKFDAGFETISKEYESYDEKKLSSYEILSLFESISTQFFQIWAYTVVNDFRTMIFFGIFTKTCNKWLVNPDDFINSLITSNNKNPYSLKPLEELRSIAELINEDQKFKELFVQSEDEILGELDNNQDYKTLKARIDGYLSDYGNRSANELKLEEPKLNEDPAALIVLLKKYIQSKPKPININNSQNEIIKLKVPFYKKWVINFLKNRSISSIYKREEFRLKRGEVFGFARRVFLEIGERFTLDGLIEKKEDIFYLHMVELMDLIRFHSLPINNLKQIIAERKIEIEKFSEVELPTRIITQGYNFEKIEYVSDSNTVLSDLIGKSTSLKNSIEGEVYVMESFDLNAPIEGKILVTKKTDPGWTIFFPLIKGIVLEKGNTLSHASIIARELGIPCVVNVENVTKTLKTDDKINVDGASGKVTVIA